MNDSVEPTIRKFESYIDGFFWVLPNIGIALVMFLLFVLAAWAARSGIVSVFRRRGRGDLGALLGVSTKWALILFGSLVIATIVFPSIRPADLLASLGIGSVAIGFAFKDILQNWLSNFLILYRQPFRTGDQIVSGGFEDTVEHIEARATFIRTYDGQRIVIPNSDIYTRATVVRTLFPTRRSEYDVGIGYSDDIEEACRVILNALKSVEGLEKTPPPEAIPWALDASTVNIRVRWWSGSRRLDVVLARGRVIAAVKRALREAGIDLPFPTRVVLLHDQTEETETAIAPASVRAGRRVIALQLPVFSIVFRWSKLMTGIAVCRRTCRSSRRGSVYREPRRESNAAPSANDANGENLWKGQFGRPLAS